MKLSYEFNPDIRHPFYLIRQSILKRIQKFAPELKGLLLDFGCGSKPYRTLFAVDKYVGLDIANPGHPHKSEPIDVFYDGKKIPFEDEHFDSVLATEVFEHIFHLDSTLIEIKRIMKPSGKILITIPFVFVEHECPNDYARYTTFGISNTLKRNGFKILQLEKTSGFIEVIGQMLIIYLNYTFVGFLQNIPLIGKFLRTFCISLLNIICWSLSRLLPLRSDLYLGIAILAEKERH